MELAQLRDRERLGWGDAGNSTMWSCAYAGMHYVYKEYSEEFRAEADQHALGGLIGWRDALPPEVRRHLDRVASWPRYRVRHNGMLLGVLIPRAPHQFFRPTYPDGQIRPNVIANLVSRRINDTVIAGATVPMKQNAIGNATDILLWFHRQDVLVNDVRELNILCTESGSEAYFVDCDVMIGPWGAVGPPAAPGYLQSLLPSAKPSRQLELVKLAWVAVWLLLDDFSLQSVPLARLTTVINAADATLIAQTANREPVDLENWRRLAGRWIKWTARATVGVTPMSTGPQVVTPSAWPLPPTKVMPPAAPSSPAGTGWVPAPYKRPRAPARTAPRATLTPQPVEERRPKIVALWTVGGAATAVVLMVVLMLLQKGFS
ncbi:hypothetical protein AB0K00_57060 [Dactylosporangium sp. NPDC049525]|uniref:hypothetical protein n=1 Tax=Dactylosporangium sp. NPDC049525 TaxID=3154730 RepID=UPI003419BA31